MVYTVYIDVVLAVNIIMDMMALATLNRVLLYRTTKRRTLIGAITGSIWSCVVSPVPGTPAAAEILGTYATVSSLMAVTAHHLKSPKEVIKSMAGIYLISVVLGGVMLVLYEHTRAGYYARLLMEAGHGRRTPAVVWFLMTAGAAMACCGLSGGIKELIRTMTYRKDLCRITTAYGEKKEIVTGLIDTDNRLREPASSQPVYVAAVGLMKQLRPTVKGVVHVPYQSVGTTNGILPAVFIDRMEIEQEGGRYSFERFPIATAKQELSPSGEYQILIRESD